MGRLRLAISLHEDPRRDYVLVMNVLCAASAGIAATLYLRLGWWSAAIAVGLLAVLELALRSRVTAWFAIAIGTAFSAVVGAIGVVAIAVELTTARAAWWVAAGIGAVAGAALMIDAHRKLRR